MPKRVLDFDALWSSDKLAACAPWAQAEYAWLYGLADCNGSFELTNLRVIWGRVAAIRAGLTIERLEQIFHEFITRGLLFTWEANGKRYGHWTGSDQPGRLPPPSWRARLERLAPAVPRGELSAFMAGFAQSKIPPRERSETLAPSSAAGIASSLSTSSLSTSRQWLEAAQVQGLDWDLGLDKKKNRETVWVEPSPNELTPAGASAACGADIFSSNSANQNLNAQRGQENSLENKSENKSEDRFENKFEDKLGNKAAGLAARSGQLAQADQRARVAYASASTNFSGATGLDTSVVGNALGNGVCETGMATHRVSSLSDMGNHVGNNAGPPGEERGAQSAYGGGARGERYTPRYRGANRWTLPELRLGTGPVLDAGRVRPEALARIHARDLRIRELQARESKVHELDGRDLEAREATAGKKTWHKNPEDAEAQDCAPFEEGLCAD